MDRWIHVLCATTAFRMGINKNDVSFVFHYTMFISLTNYIQESGRGERDGRLTECLICYRYSDRNDGLKVLYKSSKSNSARAKLTTELKSVTEYCNNTKDCRRKILLSQVDKMITNESCQGTCDNW